VSGSKNSGFTLFEVLIAMVILAIGIIALLTLQLHGMRSIRHSAYQSEALIMATELADIMRANPPRSGQPNPYRFTFNAAGGSVPAPKQCYTAVCTPQEFAAFSIGEWQERLQQAFPEASAVVCVDDTPQATREWDCTASDNSRTMAIKIGWRSAGASATAPPQLVLHVMPGGT